MALTPKTYRALGIGLLALVLLTGCVLLLQRAYTTIYDRGHQAGVDETKAAYQAAVIQAQAAQLDLQAQLTAQAARYGALQQQFTELEAQTPKEVIRHVRQDPAFAAARRPPDLHALRVRQLQSLREAASRH